MKSIKIHFSILVTGMLLTVFFLTALSVIAVTNRTVNNVVEQELHQNVEYLNNQTRLSMVHILLQNENALTNIASKLDEGINSSQYLRSQLYQTKLHDFDYLLIKSDDGVEVSAMPIGLVVSNELKEQLDSPPILKTQWSIYYQDGILLLDYMIPLFDSLSGHQNRVLHGGIILNYNSMICQKIRASTNISNIAFAHQSTLINTIQKYDSLEMQIVKEIISNNSDSLVYKKYLIGSQIFPLSDNSSVEIYSFKKAGTIVTFASDIQKDILRIFGIFLLFALLTSLLFIKVVTQPVKRLIKYINLRRNKDTVVPLQDSFIEEIDELGILLQKSIDEIHSSEEKIRTLSNNMPNGFVFQIESNLDGSDKHFIYLSEGVEDLHQQTVPAILEDPSLFYSQISEKDISQIVEMESESLKSMKSFSIEVQFTLPDGSAEWRQINSFPHISKENNILWDGICLNITQRKYTEKALEQTLANLSGVLAAASQVAIIATDTTGLITTWNSGAEKILGYSADEMVGKETPAIIHLEKEVADRSKELSELFNEEITGFDTFVFTSKFEEFEQREWTYVRKDGVLLTVNLIVTAIRNIDNQISGYLGVASDITRRKEAELAKTQLTEQLHQSQKMDAIGQLAGGVAHDFNNMLAGILGAGEFLKEEVTGKEEIEFVDMIISAANRAGYLTRQLLAFSRKGAKASTAVVVDDIIQETINLLERTINKTITIEFINNATNTGVIGDNSLLHNAFVNIGINASHAMPDGGELTFTLSNTTLDIEYCKALPFDIEAGEFLEIEIRDTGVGMSHEVQQKIFEPFFTTKGEGKGTGLGLAAVYGMVQEHDGAITVYSEEGNGTVFHIYLPLSYSIVATPEHEVQVMKGNGTILLIDDEELIRITASTQLQSFGYKVLLAENGKDGVTLFQKNRHRIDIIILDMIMPIMGGREALSKIREIDQNIPVIIASGFAKDDDIDALKILKISGFLHKPYRKQELFKKINSCLTDK